VEEGKESEEVKEREEVKEETERISEQRTAGFREDWVFRLGPKM
jgi:hypothetical protein